MRLAALAATIAALLAVALVLATSCTDPGPRAWACLFGEPPSNEAVCRLCAALPHMPASPWDCVDTITIGDRPACPTGMASCYWPDQHAIHTTQAGLAHELGHAAAECATGDPDYEHAAAWWRDIR